MDSWKVEWMKWCVGWLKGRGCTFEFWYEYDEKENEVNVRFRGSIEERIEKVCDMNIIVKIKWEGDVVKIIGGGNVYDWDSIEGTMLIDTFKRAV